MRSDARHHLRRLPVLAAALALALVAATACGSDGGAAEGDASPAASGAFPVEIKHAFGTTTIEKEPVRVVTWGWGSADAAIALGVVPVAIPFEEYGADKEGVLPWIRDALEDDDTPIPATLPHTDDPPIEAIANAEPDLILAGYSGITDRDYKTLQKIAPTVAYPKEPWATPWRETITTVGTALGRDAEAREVLADIDEEVAEEAAEHPELAGKSVALVADSGGVFYVYKPADPRVEFTHALGLVNAPSVSALADGGESFFYELSYERLAELKSDVAVLYSETAKGAETFLSSAPAQLMDQVRNDTVAKVIGAEFVASVSPPTALSLPWGLDEYVDILSAAALRSDSVSG